MVFESIIMQATQASFAGSATELMMAVAALVGVAGTFLVAIAGFMKAGKAKEFAMSAGQTAIMGAQKATEAKDRVRTITGAMYNLTPEEQKKVLNEIAPKLDKLTAEVKMGTEQINTIVEQVPGFDAKLLNIPREKFNTKPDAIGN